MSDWLFLGAFIAGAGVCFVLLKRAAAIKAFLSSQAKPRLLEAQECSIELSRHAKTVWFELLVYNPGSKDCSVTSVKLRWPNRRLANLGYVGSTLLPKTIPAKGTERIKMYGSCHKMLSAYRLELPPKQNYVRATVAIKFNTGQTIIKKITFVVKRPKILR